MTEKASTPNLTVSRRELVGKKVKQLRQAGQVPAVLYGHKKESISLVVPEKEFSKLFAEVGHTTLLNLKIDDQKATKVLIHEVQTEAIHRMPLHIDFYQVNLKEKLRTAIPLQFVGESEAVEVLGGSLITVKDEVEVECLPEDLIQHLEIDISVLKSFEDMIHVSDLKAPEGMVILDEPEEVIASILEPRSEEELAELEEKPVEDVSQVEVETSSGTDSDAAAEEEEKKEEK